MIERLKHFLFYSFFCHRQSDSIDDDDYHDDDADHDWFYHHRRDNKSDQLAP